MDKKIGRNDPCICGSGKKYKKCCEALKDNSDFLMEDPNLNRIRKSEGQIIHEHLLPYVSTNFGTKIFKEALDIFYGDFSRTEEIEQAFYECMFIPWMLFNWIREENIKAGWYLEKKIDSSILPEKLIGLLYLQKKSRSLTKYQLDFLEKICLESYYSFYLVEEVKRNQSITVKDLLLNTIHLVKEKQGNNSIEPGNILYSRILNYDNQVIFVGTAPIIINGDYIAEIDKLKLILKEKNNAENISPGDCSLNCVI